MSDPPHTKSPRDPPWSFRLLSALTRRIPALPHATGLSNRLVKPLWCRFHAGCYRIELWDGIQMIVDPADALGGNLAFVPQLYDVWERRAIRELVPPGGTFVDVGSNLGAYALWAARVVGPRGRVIAYEAEPRNHAALEQNIALNGLDQIRAYQVGVSDQRETLALRLNPGHNIGGHTFTPGVHQGERVQEVEVQCDALAALLAAADVTSVDFMKLDIEGFEQRVLGAFFRDVPPGSPLRPRYLLTELFFGSAAGPGTLVGTIQGAGYTLERQSGGNALFRRR